MRNSIRIDNFLSKVDIRDLLLNIWKVCDENYVDSLEKLILDNIGYITEEWKFMYDIRFSQILVNLGFIPNMPGPWYHYEEDEILKMQGYKPRDYIFWGSIYDSDGKRLDDTKYNLIKDLEITHMQKLIDGTWLQKDSYVYKIISDELRIRSRREKLKKLKNIS